jgi:hypothetical protein
MRRFRLWPAIEVSPFWAMLSQVPCLGLWWISNLPANRIA